MKRHFIVIGAGISGLALGWFLKKRCADNCTLTIFEAAERPGGWIRTHHEQGFLFEKGPRSCRTKGAGLETLQLIEELGLEQEVICASPEAEKRFIYFNGKVEAVPNTLFSFLRSPLMKGVLPALWKEWRIPRSALEDESIASFAERRFGKEIAEKFLDPLVSGIYAGDIKKLSLRSCFPEMYRLEQEHGSVLKGLICKKRGANSDFSPFLKAMSKTPLFSFRNGMETLIQALHRKLREEVRLSSRVKAVYCKKESVEVELSEGERFVADHVFLAVPAPVAAMLIKPVGVASLEKIAKYSYASVAVVGMGWHEKVLKQEGFGYLVPSSERQRILGVVFDSSAFAEQNQEDKQTRLTAMIGGMHHPEIEQASFEELKKIAQEAIHRHLGITSIPDVTHITVAKQAIPQYEVGHHAHVMNIKSDLATISASRLSLLGSAWNGVAVNDCIAEAKDIANGIILETAIEDGKLTQPFDPYSLSMGAAFTYRE